MEGISAEIAIKNVNGDYTVESSGPLIADAVLDTLIQLMMKWRTL